VLQKLVFKQVRCRRRLACAHVRWVACIRAYHCTCRAGGCSSGSATRTWTTTPTSSSS
jgi:hypothetical protein